MTKGEATRQRIIATAAPLFNQLGFDGCSMQDLMQATGLEKGGIYRHFANKQDLAAEAFRFALAQNVKVRTDHLADTANSIARLRNIIKIFVETPSVVPGGCPLMNTAIDTDDGNEVLRNLAREGIDDWRNRLSKIIEVGIAAGEIRKKTDPRRIANTIIAALEGALMISRLEDSKTALRDAQAALDIVLEDIIPSSRKRP